MSPTGRLQGLTENTGTLRGTFLGVTRDLPVKVLVDRHLAALSWDETWEQMHLHVKAIEQTSTAGAQPIRMDGLGI